MKLQIHISVLLCLPLSMLCRRTLNVLDFPFDQNSEDNYVSLAIEGRMPESFTLCSALLFSAMPYEVGFLVQVLQFFHKEQDTKVGFRLSLDEYSFGLRTFGGRLISTISLDQLDPSTWIHFCYSDDKSNDVLIVNGEALLNDSSTMRSLSDYDWGEGMTINMGHQLTGKMSKVNIFAPALPIEVMQNLTNTDHNECRASTGILLGLGKGNKIT